MKNNEWISVDNKLPKNKEKILLFTKRDFKDDDNIIKGWYDAKYELFFSSELHEDEYIFPTHWQPLPPPPKNP